MNGYNGTSRISLLSQGAACKTRSDRDYKRVTAFHVAYLAASLQRCAYGIVVLGGVRNEELRMLLCIIIHCPELPGHDDMRSGGPWMERLV